MIDYSNPLFRAGRLVRQFLRSGGGGEFTKPFTEFPEDLQRRLATAAGLLPDEVAAIACGFDEDSWIVLTNVRLVFQDSEGVKSLYSDEIEDVRMDHRYMQRVGGKQNMDRLDVITHRGEIVRLSLEAGYPFFGFWNAINLFTRWRSPKGGSP